MSPFGETTQIQACFVFLNLKKVSKFAVSIESPEDNSISDAEKQSPLTPDPRRVRGSGSLAYTPGGYKLVLSTLTS